MDDVLNIEPLLDRLELLEGRMEWLGRVEAKIDALSRAPRIVAAPENLRPDAEIASHAAQLAELTRRVEVQARELSELRAAASAKSTPTPGEVSALVERLVSERFAVLRVHNAEDIARSVEEGVATRIGSVERAAAGQSESIEALRVKSAETDANLQRLVSAIEKLCERAQLIAPLPEAPRFGPVPPAVFAPPPRFESQLQDAMRREPVVPKIRTEEPRAEELQKETPLPAAEPVTEVKNVEVEIPAPSFLATVPPPAKKSRFLFRNR